MSERDSEAEEVAVEKPRHYDPEYMLKGVQAFAVSVALFAATFAIASVPFQLVIGHGRPLWVFVLVYLVVFALGFVISLFAVKALLLGFSMAGLWAPKRELSLPDAAGFATAIVISFSLMNAALVFADENGVLTIGGP